MDHIIIESSHSFNMDQNNKRPPPSLQLRDDSPNNKNDKRSQRPQSPSLELRNDSPKNNNNKRSQPPSPQPSSVTPSKPPPPRPRIYYEEPERIITVQPQDFKALVQRLTGLNPTATSSSSSSTSSSSSSTSSTSSSTSSSSSSMSHRPKRQRPSSKLLRAPTTLPLLLPASMSARYPQESIGAGSIPHRPTYLSQLDSSLLFLSPGFSNPMLQPRLNQQGSTSRSPAPPYAAAYQTNNKLGFMPGVQTRDQFYNQNRAIGHFSSSFNPTGNLPLAATSRNLPLEGSNIHMPFIPSGFSSLAAPYSIMGQTSKSLMGSSFQASNERGFMPSVGTTHQFYNKNQAIEQFLNFNPAGSLSSEATTFMPSISPRFSSPAARYATMEQASNNSKTSSVNQTSNELGFMKGVETNDQFYHQNQAFKQPSNFNPAGSLSSENTTFMPSILPDFSSPASRYGTMEQASNTSMTSSVQQTSNQLGFERGVETRDQFHHQNRAIEQSSNFNPAAGNLSSRNTTYLPSISPDFSSPAVWHGTMEQASDTSKTSSDHQTSNELGFMRGLETRDQFHHQDRPVIEQPSNFDAAGNVLSENTTYLSSILPDFSSPADWNGTMEQASNTSTTSSVQKTSNELELMTNDQLYEQNQAFEQQSDFNELGFARGVETGDQIYHQNRAIEQSSNFNPASCNLSSENTTYLPSISPEFSSQAARYGTMEQASDSSMTSSVQQTLNELEFMQGVDTNDQFYHQEFEQPSNFNPAGNLSSEATTFMPSISPDFSYPAARFGTEEQTSITSTTSSAYQSSNELGFMQSLDTNDQFYHQTQTFEQPSDFNPTGNLSSKAKEQANKTSTPSSVHQSSNELGFLQALDTNNDQFYHQTHTFEQPSDFNPAGNLSSEAKEQASNTSTPSSVQQTSNQLGFERGVETRDHQTTSKEQLSSFNPTTNLSSDTTFLPSDSPKLFLDDDDLQYIFADP